MNSRLPFDDNFDSGFFSPSAAAPLPEDEIDLQALLEFVRNIPTEDIEAAAATSEQVIDPALADAVFVPEAYEPNYAYPLIIWLTDTTTRQYELCRVMPQISTRNYFGVSLSSDNVESGEWKVESGEGTFDTLGLPRLNTLEQRLFDTVVKMRNVYHIHSERIYLAGFGSAATQALQIGLSHPEWFAGVAAIAAEFPKSPRLLSRLHDVRGMRVFLGAGSQDAAAIDNLQRTGRLLHTAGLRVCSRLYDTGREVVRPMLQEIDRWVMREMCQPVSV